MSDAIAEEEAISDIAAESEELAENMDTELVSVSADTEGDTEAQLLILFRKKIQKTNQPKNLILGIWLSRRRKEIPRISLLRISRRRFKST